MFLSLQKSQRLLDFPPKQCISGKIYVHMHKIFDMWNFIVTIKACVYHFYFCHQKKKKTFKKLSKMLFILPKSSFCPPDFQIFVLHSSHLFSFLGYFWFYRRSWLMINSKVYGLIISVKLRRFFNIW